MAGVAYLLLQHAIVARNGRTSALAAALGSDRKGKLSLALYVAVALMWFVPDRRIESTVNLIRPD
jgi:hypothetical protein